MHARRFDITQVILYLAAQSTVTELVDDFFLDAHKPVT